MRTIRTLLKGLGLALLLVIVAGWVPAYSGAFGLYWERYAGSFLTNPLNPAYRWYQPLETVPGAHVPLPKAPDGAAAFKPGVLEAAAEYARLHNSDSLLVLHRGALVFQQYWNTMKPESLFGAHSMTKTLTAIMVGHAIADGHIASADEPAYRYLREWDDAEHRKITIRHLLQMASGLKESYDFSPWSLRMQRAMGTDIVEPNLRTEVGGPPGVKFAHINPPAQLLGIIVERATGRRFGEYLAEKFWKPIGARDAQLFVDRPEGLAHTDCCMWTSIEDWARVGEVLRNGGLWNGEQVVPVGWVGQMLTPSAAYANYGMMIWLASVYERDRIYDPDVAGFANHHSEPFAAPLFYLDGLHVQRVWVVPSRELVIVRTGLSDPEWDESRLPNLLIRGLIE
jgi:CubicO group peptidase (beta-lactamase class C family)